MTWQAPAPVPILTPPAHRAHAAGPLPGSFTSREAASAFDLLGYDWPPLVDVATRLVAHLGLELAMPTDRRPVPMAAWLAQRAAVAFANRLRDDATERGRAFLDRLLADCAVRLPGLRIVADEGVWQPRLALPLPVFLDCATAPRVAYAPPEPDEGANLRAWLLADLPPFLRQSWRLDP